jgi:hypothetical protein
MDALDDAIAEAEVRIEAIEAQLEDVEFELTTAQGELIGLRRAAELRPIPSPSLQAPAVATAPAEERATPPASSAPARPAGLPFEIPSRDADDPAPPTRVEPSARATASVRPSPGFYQSPERDAVIRAGYPSGVPIEELWKQINALPGLQYEMGRISTRANEMGLRRPEGWDKKLQRVVQPKQPALRSERAVAPGALPPKIAPPGPPAVSGHSAIAPKPAAAPPEPQRTTERELYLRRKIAEGKHVDAVADSVTSIVNTMSGGKMTSVDVKAWWHEIVTGPSASVAA